MAKQTPKSGTRLAAVLILLAVGWSRSEVKRALMLKTGEVANAIAHLKTIMESHSGPHKALA